MAILIPHPEGVGTNFKMFLAPISFGDFPYPQPLLGVTAAEMPVVGDVINLLLGAPDRGSLCVHLSRESSALLRAELEQLEGVLQPGGRA